MKLSKNFRCITVILSLLTILLLSGCGEDSDNMTQPESTARISGKVYSSGTPGALAKTTAPVEGASVTVARLQADGSFQTVSTGAAQTNANGEFQVEANVSSESGLFVIAEKGSLRWMAVVNSTVEAGETTVCQPHTDESTAEAEAAREDVQEDQSRDIAYADIAAYIDAELAGNIKGNATAIATVVGALKSSGEARQQALLHSEIGATSAQIQSAAQARATAQQQLEASLYQAGENQSMIEAAYESYHQALINAYVNAGLTASAYAKAGEVAARSWVKNTATLSTQARLAAVKSAAYLRAWAIARGNEARFQAAGAAQAQVNAVVNAGISLRAAIRSAASESEIMAAFESYHNTVIEQLKITLSAQATVISNIDVAINEVGGAKATLAVAVNAAASTNALVDAYMAYYSAVKTLVNTMATTATQTEINLMTEVLILTNVYL